jgi:PilZ domain
MELSGPEARTLRGGVADRRRTTRFPVSEDLKYRVLHKSSRIAGAGKTLNIGSGGVLFTTEEQLPLGRQVEIAVNWPARLGGTCPLKFVASGRVVRAEASVAAVLIERYEFRTRSSSREAPRTEAPKIMHAAG